MALPSPSYFVGRGGSKTVCPIALLLRSLSRVGKRGPTLSSSPYFLSFGHTRRQVEVCFTTCSAKGTVEVAATIPSLLIEGFGEVLKCLSLPIVGYARVKGVRFSLSLSQKASNQGGAILQHLSPLLSLSFCLFKLPFPLFFTYSRKGGRGCWL